MANPEHLAIFERGIEAWNAWCRENREPAPPDLTGVQLAGADLEGVDLHDANLRRVNFTQCYFFQADVSGADLTGGRLTGSDLGNAKLAQANLQNAYLSRARLNFADLTRANLREARLRESGLNSTTLVGADLRNIDLTNADQLVAWSFDECCHGYQLGDRPTAFCNQHRLPALIHFVKHPQAGVLESSSGDCLHVCLRHFFQTLTCPIPFRSSMAYWPRRPRSTDRATLIIVSIYISHALWRITAADTGRAARRSRSGEVKEGHRAQRSEPPSPGRTSHAETPRRWDRSPVATAGCRRS